MMPDSPDFQPERDADAETTREAERGPERGAEATGGGEARSKGAAGPKGGQREEGERRAEGGRGAKGAPGDKNAARRRARESGPSITVRAPAKINWTLAVTGRREDGYHSIDTVMQAISLMDELTIRPKRRAACALQCDDPAVPLNRTNLIHRAWAILHETYPDHVKGVEVRLKKAIPMGAGLGGGSSDAAAMLQGANELFSLGLSRDTLAGLAAQIGSDVPFFIHRRPARCSGRGEIVSPIASAISSIDVVIVFPGFTSPTAEAYSMLTEDDFARPSRAPGAVKAMKDDRPDRLIEAITNVFDEMLTRVDPRYEQVKARMQAAGLIKPTIAGSGSALFGIARDRTQAERAGKMLRAQYRQTFVVRTLR